MNMSFEHPVGGGKTLKLTYNMETGQWFGPKGNLVPEAESAKLSGQYMNQLPQSTPSVGQGLQGRIKWGTKEHVGEVQKRYEELLAQARKDVEHLASNYNIPLDRISYSMNPTPYTVREIPGGPPFTSRIDAFPGKTILDYGSWDQSTILPSKTIQEDPQSVKDLHKFLFRHRDFPIQRDLRTEGTQLAGIGSHDLEYSGLRHKDKRGRALLRMADLVPFFDSKQRPGAYENPSAKVIREEMTEEEKPE